MHEGPIKFLLIEDDEDEVFLIDEAIRDAGADDITLEHAGTLQSGLNKLADETFDAVLLDLSLPDSSGVDGVTAVAQAARKIPLIVCTGLNDESVGQDAIRCGAQDYLVKNPRLYGAIPRILRYTVERNRLINLANEKVEQAKKYTELLLTQVIAIANSGLGITNNKGTFSLVNPALAELVSCSTVDLVGTPWTDILVKEDRAAELQSYKKSFNRSVNYDRDRLTLQRKDGGTIEVPMQSVLVELDGDRLCRVLSFGGSTISKSNVDAASPGNQIANELQIRVSNDGAPLAASRLQIIGLQALKAELGDRWELVDEQISSLAGSTIAKHLDAGDSFTRNQDGDFIICFDGLSEQQARSKAQTISQDIRERILRYCDEGELADYELDPAILAGLANVRTETYAVQVSAEENAGSLDISAVISSKIDEAVARARAKAKTMLAEIQNSSRNQLREAHQRRGKGSSLMIHDFDPDTRQWIAQLKNATNDAAETAYELDCLSLGSAAQYIYNLGAAKVPLIAVDIHFSTLADKALFSKFESVCQSYDEQATQSLVLKITGLPQNIRSRELALAAKALGPYSRLQMIQLKSLDLANLDLHEAAIRLVAIDYADVLDSYVRDKAKCKKFVKMIQKGGARLIVDRISTQECGFLFSDLGVDFISYERLAALSA